MTLLYILPLGATKFKYFMSFIALTASRMSSHHCHIQTTDWGKPSEEYTAVTTPLVGLQMYETDTLPASYASWLAHILLLLWCLQRVRLRFKVRAKCRDRISELTYTLFHSHIDTFKMSSTSL